MKMKFFIIGISLLELVITICIMGIIYISSSFIYQNFMYRQEMNKIYQTIKHGIVFAKINALSQHQNIIICSSENFLICENNYWHKGMLIFVDKNMNKERDSTEKILLSSKTDLKYGTLIWKGFGNDQVLRFRSDNGLPLDSNGTFHYSAKDPDYSLNIYVSRMAQTRFEKTNK